MRACLLACSLLIACARAPEPTPSVAATAPPIADVQTILAKMKERYATAKTYRDEGTYKDVYIELNGVESHRVAGQFKTRWRQPNRLLFIEQENVDEWGFADRIAVWRDASGATRSLFLDEVNDEEDLDTALDDLHGVSKGTTGLVPSWLAGRPCACTLKYHFTQRVQCANARCFVLEADVDANHMITLFIDTTTFALRRYATRHKIVPRPHTDAELARLPETVRERVRNRKFEPFIVESEIVYTPEFDVKLDESDFAFDPTASSSTDRPAH
jgi:hypothetical protein